ncbi:MAG: hypothetical protein M0C28_17210 [Candidatus Moduliflexus flocculans]|nr:hypothetical protein [Candidatus Moduliflexus flocculans]
MNAVISGQNAMIATVKTVKRDEEPQFHVLEVISEGSMGVIYYKEDDETLDRIVF